MAGCHWRGITGLAPSLAPGRRGEGRLTRRAGLTSGHDSLSLGMGLGVLGGGTRHCLDHCGCPLWLAVRRLEIDLGGKRVGTLVCLQLGSPPQPPSNFKQDEALLWQLWELWEAVRLPSRGIDPVFAARYRAGSCCATDFSEQPTAKTASRLVVSD